MHGARRRCRATVGDVRRLALLALLVACGHPAQRLPEPRERFTPRLQPPPLLDYEAPGAAYLSAVALQLQPGWGQFLDDCRIRLPPDHPLNDLHLAAVADLAIDGKGKIAVVSLQTSGNADFDRAVHDALRDADPLPAPPRDMWSDDDRVHLQWMFARDRRRAGPATAHVVDVELPVVGVVERLVRAGDLTRAARRILKAPASAERSQAISLLAIAGLREGIASTDGASRRAAVEAIARADVRELLPAVRPLLTTTSDAELRLVAIEAASALADDASSEPLLAQLKADLADDPRLARAEAAALVGLGQGAQVADLAKAALDGQKRPNLAALEILAVAPVPQLAAQLATWARRGDPQTRAAVCMALAGLPAKTALPLLAKGLRDRDAQVRVACITASRSVQRLPAGQRARLRELARDRDRSVRAAAVGALAALGASVARVTDDPAPAVRAAHAAGLAGADPGEAVTDLVVLVEDRHPDVRAAAWRSLAVIAPKAKVGSLDELAARALADPAALVREAAIALVADEDRLVRATTDANADVRTAAFVRLAMLRGRAGSEALLVERFAAAPPGSAERVRTALAWLLAR